MKIAIIGAGAAGFFAAINLMKLKPQADVTIYESGTRVLPDVSAFLVYLLLTLRCYYTKIKYKVYYLELLY